MEFRVRGNLVPECDRGRRLPLGFEPNAGSRFAGTEELNKLRGFGLVLRALGNPQVPAPRAAGWLSFFEIRNWGDFKIDPRLLESADIPFATYKYPDLASREQAR